MDVDRIDPKFNTIVGPDAPFDQIAHGTYFGEGPVWDRRQRRFLWTDIIGDTIHQWTPGVGRSVLVHPSSHANGMTFDLEGRLTIAGWSQRTIWRIEHDGSFTTLASNWQGKKFNSPNDIVVRSDGSVYWTDSAGGLVIPGMVGEDLQRHLDIQAVFRLTPQGKVELTIEDTVYPNGLCFSPDEKILYVNDTRMAHIRAFDVESGRQRSPTDVCFTRSRVARPASPTGSSATATAMFTAPGPAACMSSIPSGKLLGRLLVPGGHTTNIGWGDDDWRSLYMTTYHAVFRTRLNIPGVPVW